MSKYRCKVTGPWGYKGDILNIDSRHSLCVESVSYKFHGKCVDFPDLFELIEEEVPKRWAKAVYWLKAHEGIPELDRPILSENFYSSIDDARKDLLYSGNPKGIRSMRWPAKFDKDHFLVLEDL